MCNALLIFELRNANPPQCDGITLQISAVMRRNSRAIMQRIVEFPLHFLQGPIHIHICVCVLIPEHRIHPVGREENKSLR